MAGITNFCLTICVLFRMLLSIRLSLWIESHNVTIYSRIWPYKIVQEKLTKNYNFIVMQSTRRFLNFSANLKSWNWTWNDKKRVKYAMKHSQDSTLTHIKHLLLLWKLFVGFLGFINTPLPLRNYSFFLNAQFAVLLLGFAPEISLRPRVLTTAVIVNFSWEKNNVL